jgi:hypothetical protein
VDLGSPEKGAFIVRVAFRLLAAGGYERRRAASAVAHLV